jgi:BASS family bile acid:Na+ symporter
MDPKTFLPIVIQISTMLIIVSVGLRSRWSDLGHIFNRPAILLRGVIAVYVAVPLTAFAAAMLLPVEPAVGVSIVAMALSPLAPMAPGKMLEAGTGTSYAVGMYVALMILAVVAVPPLLMLMGMVAGGGSTIRPGVIAWLVLTGVILPLLAGLCVGSFAPAAARRLAGPVSAAAMATLAILVVLIIVAVHAEILGLVGNGTLLAIALAELAGLACGHWLGGPDPARRMALAQAAASRHPGLAVLMIGQNYEVERRTLAAVLLYLVVGIVLSACYARWARGRGGTPGAA